MLAFSRFQLARFGNTADIVVTDDNVDPTGETLRSVGDPSETIRMFVADTGGPTRRRCTRT